MTRRIDSLKETSSRINDYRKEWNDGQQAVYQVTLQRRVSLQRVVSQQALKAVDDTVHLLTVVTGAVLLVIERFVPGLFAVSSLYSLFLTLFIWIAYRVAQIKNAIDLRLLVVGFGYQVFGVWIIGIVGAPALGGFLLFLLDTLGFQVAIDYVAVLTLLLALLITLGSREAAKTFGKKVWNWIVTDEYKDPSLGVRYRRTALAFLKHVLPHGFPVFLLFFAIYWIAELPPALSETGLIPLVGFLVGYTLYKSQVYVRVQKEEAEKW